MSVRPDNRPSLHTIPATLRPGENKERLTTPPIQSNLSPTPAPGSAVTSSSSNQVEILERLIACIKAL
ncbi:hypothetical protein [Thermanaerothrix sp.]|jgi:hypothetical protein|uniref:hypothetical protein n=1 Tax=Thermanaerothrix sp. TaxID=2972675 RepID=UPI002ADD810E|nr:hypothetical protein [Thermanaerothrix sp.]